MNCNYKSLIVLFFFLFSIVLNSQTKKEEIETISRQYSASVEEAEQFYNFRKNLIVKPSEKPLVKSSSTLCSTSLSNNNQNIGFELGDYSNWDIKHGTIINALTDSVVNVSLATTSKTLLTTGVDALTGMSYNSPFAGNYVIKLNDAISTTEATFMSTDFVVTPANNILKTAFSFVSMNAAHSCEANPYYKIQLYTCSGTNLIKEYTFIPDYGLCQGYNPGFFNPMVTIPGGGYFATNWKKICFDLRDYIGQEVKLKIFVADCIITAHYGYVYFDAEFGYLPSNPPLINTFSVNSTAYTYSTGVSNQCFNPGSILLSQGSTTVNYPFANALYTSSTATPITISKHGTYNIIQTPVTGCDIVNNIEIKVKPTLSVTVSTPTTCFNGVSSYTLAGANNYTVKINGNFYSTYGPSYAPIVLGLAPLPVNVNTITVIGDNGSNCSDSVITTLQVFPQASIAVNYPATICNGITNLSASGIATYTWNGSVNTQTYNANVNGVTTVNVAGKDNNGCLAAPSTVTIIGVPITLTVSPLTSPSSPICVQDSAYCYVSGAQSYTWSNGFTGCCQYIKPTLTNTTFSVAATNSCGITNTFPFAFSVQSGPPLNTFTVNYSSIPVCPGTTFTVQGTGASFYFKWGATGQYNNSVNAFVSNANPTFTAIALGSPGGCNTTTVITVPTLPSPTLSVVGNSVCSGQTSATLIGSGANTYTWNSSAVSPTFGVATGTNNFNVNLNATNSSGCTSYSTFPVVIENSQPIGISGNSTTVCTGANTLILTATPFAAGGTYSWSTGATTQSITVSPTVTTTYSVFTNSNLCGSAIYTITINVSSSSLTPLTYSISPICVGKNYTITVNGASSYQYNNGTSTPINTVVIAAPALSFPTFVTIKGIQSSGCVSTITVPISSSPNPGIGILYPMGTYGCKNGTMNISAQGAFTYTWSTASTGSIVAITPSVNTTYSVIGTAVSGCTGSATSGTIYGVNPPTITITPPSPSVCLNSPFTLSASVVGGSGFTWNGSTTGSTFSSSINTPTVYSVSSSTSFCTVTKTVSISIHNPITFSVTNSLCSGIINTINYNGSPPGGTLYINNVATNTVYSTISNTFNVSYNYQDTGNCLLKTNAQVVINQKPCVKLSVSDYSTCVGNQVTFTGTPSGGFYSSNVTGNAMTLPAIGSYTASYTYSDANNCSSTICTEINASICTDLKTNDLKLINLFPNPSNNAVTISNPSGGEIFLKVYDINGRLLTEKKLNEPISEINISNYANGLYIFYLEVENDRRFIKVIKE